MSQYILSQFPEERNKNKKKDITNDISIAVAIFIVFIALIGVMAVIHCGTEDPIPELEPVPIEVEETLTEIEESEPPEIIPVKEAFYSDEELIAKVVMAEAEGEEMVGKVAVAMTVLNRCDYYGLTVETVVFAELNGVKQYSISDTYNDECMRAVEIAKETRDLFPDTMMWFKTDGYHDFKNGNPQDYMPIGKHYFSYLDLKEE